MADPAAYADVPSALRTIMHRLNEYLQLRPAMPSIMDPSGTGENFSDRWDQEGYGTFRSSMIRYAEWVEDAYTDTDPARSLVKWQRVFGDDFKRAEAVRASEALVKSASGLPVQYRETNQELADLNISARIDPAYKFRIQGRVLRKGSMGPFYLHDRGDRVMRGREIRFSVAECNVPEPFQLYWKVRNRGSESLKNDSVRGEIIEGNRTWMRDEPTAFSGPHFVECYAVRSGVCVAKDRQAVIIL